MENIGKILLTVLKFDDIMEVYPNDEGITSKWELEISSIFVGYTSYFLDK